MTKCRNQDMLYQWEAVLMEEVITTIHIQLLEVAIELFLLIFMYPDVHHQPKLYCMVFYSYKKKLEEKEL